MRFAAKSAVMIVIVVVGLSGCSNDEGNGGRADPSPTSAPPAQGNQVPRVSTPIDPTPFLGNPCELLDRSVLAEVGSFEPGEPDVDSEEAKNLLGPGCGWKTADLSKGVSLRIRTVRREKAAEGLKGLGATYDAKAIGSIDELQPLALEGHPGNPAAVAGLSADILAGECPVEVGLADDLTYYVRVTYTQNPAEACKAAQKLATAALDTMAKGS